MGCASIYEGLYPRLSIGFDIQAECRLCGECLAGGGVLPHHDRMANEDSAELCRIGGGFARNEPLLDQIGMHARPVRVGTGACQQRGTEGGWRCMKWSANGYCVSRYLWPYSIRAAEALIVRRSTRDPRLRQEKADDERKGESEQRPAAVVAGAVGVALPPQQPVEREREQHAEDEIIGDEGEIRDGEEPG